jgi:hypothetical protein
MEKFIIEMQVKINGKFEKHYHQNITEQKNKEAMNVYVEHITSKKREAKIFYDEDEAKRVAIMFEQENLKISKVIPL